MIFEDGPAQDEENGEFPSKWDLYKGQIEIAELDGETVIMLRDGNPSIVPYLKNSDKDYLPEVFTIEFDFYRPPKGNRFCFYLHDRKNQKHQYDNYLTVGHNYLKWGDVQGIYPGDDLTREGGRWYHISIAYTKGKLKCYMNDTRLINIPHFGNEPTGCTVEAYWSKPDILFFLKNFRISEGGVKYYDRMMQDGKIICTGIKFDVNKATLKPESMGPINEVFELMEKYPNISFCIEGHTDSDGDNDFNQTLSEERAATVMATLIDLGISADRLSSNGWGETKPIGPNNTAEGKANNRRVEFVKQ